MSKPRIDMHRLQDLVRLHRLGTPPVEVARLLAMSRKTERAYREALKEEGLLGGDPRELPEQELLRAAVERRIPRKVAKQQESSAERWRTRIATLVEKGKAPKAIYARLCEEDREQFKASYDAVYRLIRRLRRERGVSPDEVAIPVVTRPGLEAQVDFGYVGVLLDPTTGKQRKTWVFVLTLSHSRYMVPILVHDQSEETWLRCHEEAFEILGGVPERIVPDNLKPAVIRRAFSVDEQTTLNRAYRELARHFGCKVDPTGVRKPEHKPHAEAGVKYVKRGFFGSRELETSDFEVERRKLAQWAREVAGLRTHGTTRRQPLRVLEEEERAALLPLPREPFERRRWARHTVHQDSHVRFDKAYYSVPFTYLHQEVEVCGTARSVTIYLEGQRLATHARVAAGEWSTVEEHLPAHRAPYRHRDPATWQARADAIGCEAGRYVRAVLEQDPVLSHLHHAQRAVLALEGVPVERAEAACHRALAFGNLKVRSLEEILAKGLEAAPLVGDGELVAAERVAEGVPREPSRPRFARSGSELAAGLRRGVA